MFCSHYLLGLEHGKQELTPAQARERYDVDAMGLDAFCVKACLRYLDGYHEGKDGFFSRRAEANKQVCPCSWTIK